MKIKPFKAYRFSEAVVGDVGRCIAPPYDVIRPAQQKRLYEKSQYNIVRITKGITTPADSQADNQYTRAAEVFKNWLATGALAQDAVEAIYGYVQDFQIGGADFQRLTFIALAKLEELGAVVRPHERILSEPITDRLNLVRATQAQFGLVFMLYEDPDGVADKAIQKVAVQKPVIDFVDDDAVRHRVFAIADKKAIASIAKMMRNKTCVIADGHHRYTTGLLYAKESDNPAAQCQMLGFCNTRHEGLIVLATHRLVGGLDNFNFDDLLSGLETSFKLTKYPFDPAQGRPFNSDGTKLAARRQMLEQMKAEHQRDKNAFGIYGAAGAPSAVSSGPNCFYVAVLADASAMDSAAPDMSVSWRSLDVAILQKLILEKLLGIGDEQLAGGKHIEYVKDGNHAVDEVIAKVDSGCKQAAFFLNPPKIRQIQLVAEHGERMPQKSTYFYPKLFTGLTIQKL